MFAHFYFENVICFSLRLFFIQIILFFFFHFFLFVCNTFSLLPHSFHFRFSSTSPTFIFDRFMSSLRSENYYYVYTWIKNKIYRIYKRKFFSNKKFLFDLFEFPFCRCLVLCLLLSFICNDFINIFRIFSCMIDWSKINLKHDFFLLFFRHNFKDDAQRINTLNELNFWQPKFNNNIFCRL